PCACRWRKRGPGRRASARGGVLPKCPALRRDLRGSECCRPSKSAPDVLLVQRADVDRLRLLSGVRMLGAGIDAQIAELLLAERAARQHALDSLLDDAVRETAGEDIARGAFLDAARIAGMPVVLLVLELVAREHGLLGI